MAAQDNDKGFQKSVRKHLMISLVLVLTLVGGAGAWASLTEISGAVVASGNIVVESNIKQVQHPEGGIVKTITVKNGDEVQAGELLILLDDTITRANLAIITKQLDDLYAQEARLLAEQAFSEEIDFSQLMQESTQGENRLNTIINSQKSLYEARSKSLEGQKQQINEQIVQHEKQIEGLIAQRDSKESERKFVIEELDDLSSLLSQQLVSASRVSVLNREKVKLEGEIGGFTSQIAQVNESIGEKKIKILQLESEFLASVLEQLQQTRSNIAQLQEQKIAAEDQLDRIEIKAPQSGVVHNLNIHTIGGVIGPAETTMLIVPQEDQLVVESKVEPVNINQLAANQNAIVRFPSFDQRTTPELNANITTISPDLLQDQTTGLSYFQVRLVIPKEELTKLKDKSLIPGMPVEVFIKTNYRSVLSYLVKPVTDQVTHALRER